MSARTADVYKRGVLAARIDRESEVTRFSYLPEYVASGGSPVATTLPLTAEPFISAVGSVPPYFAGLLPEGRRLTALARHLKISLDDEFSLLTAVGSNAVGDVTVKEQGADDVAGEDQLTLPPDLNSVRFANIAAGLPEFVGIAGVQEKVTARMISLPARFAGGEYILKLNPPEFPRLAENEDYFQRLAGRCGLSHAEAELVKDRDGESALVVKRFDRADGGEMLAVEDGCQALGRWPADKYLVSSEEMVWGISDNCDADIVARRDLFAQIAFAVVTGNGDAHAKNFSIVQQEGEWRVSPLYDVPSSVFYGDTTLALSIGGGTQPPGRRKLLDFASRLDLPERAASRVIDTILEGTEGMIAEIESGALGLDQHRVSAGLEHLRFRRRQLVKS